VLQAVLLDVLPHLLGDLGAGDRRVTHDLGEIGRRLHRLHEAGVGLALGLGLVGSLLVGHGCCGLLPLRKGTQESALMRVGPGMPSTSPERKAAAAAHFELGMPGPWAETPRRENAGHWKQW